MTRFGPAEFQARAAAGEQAMADLHVFRELLAEWNGRMNLVGPSALGEFWLRHAWDSAQLFHVKHSPPSPESLQPPPQSPPLTWADLGAGAGFPGVVLAILLKGRPGARVHLVESQAKRCGFLTAVVEALDLPATVHHARAESLALSVERVAARACAPVERLLDYTAPYLKRGAVGLFLKGGGVEAELTQARARWKLRADLLPSLSDPSGRILRVEGLSRA